MKIDCLKKCQAGDTVHISYDDKYYVTSHYIDALHPSVMYGRNGYILLRNSKTLRDTFVTAEDMTRITRIVKAR